MRIGKTTRSCCRHFLCIPGGFHAFWKEPFWRRKHMRHDMAHLAEKECEKIARAPQPSLRILEAGARPKVKRRGLLKLNLGHKPLSWLLDLEVLGLAKAKHASHHVAGE